MNITIHADDPEVVTEADIDIAAEIEEADDWFEHQRREAEDTWAQRHAAHLWRTR